MKKLLYLVFLAACLVAPAAADVQYSGNVDKEKVMLNTSIQLECQDRCPVSRWTITWTVPENAEILEIRDSLGEIKDYERTGRSVSITTNDGEPRRNETLRIRMKIDEPAEKMYQDLHYRKFSLPSFRGETTTGVFKVEDLVSGWIGFGFQNSFTDNEFRFRGEGPTNIRLNSGEGMEKRYYEFFGEDRDNSTEAYSVAVGTTGLVQGFERFPVAVMDDYTYNRSVNRWSSGEYTAGTITLRDDLEEDYLPVLAHETVHGLNDEFLRWDQTRSSYIDEGVSEHVEYLMNKRLYREGRKKTGTREVFGDEKEYEVEKNGKRYIYTLNSQGDRDRLWQYYQEDSEFMKQWSPSQSSEYREFGYAYSELLIKNYIVNQGTVRELYSDIQPNRKIESPEEKWNYLSQYMNMEPCNHDSRERFDRCLDQINDHDYSIYTATPDRTDNGGLDIGEIELPNRTQKTDDSGLGKNVDVSFRDFLKGFFDYLLSLLE